jgi:TPP-dependent pyruvate/acetoin dehydrogenase alpha subunit
MELQGNTIMTQLCSVEQERDPIERIRKLLLSLEIASVADLKTLEKEAKSEVDEALAKAKESPQPDVSELFSHIWVKGYGAEVPSGHITALVAHYRCQIMDNV